MESNDTEHEHAAQSSTSVVLPADHFYGGRQPLLGLGTRKPSVSFIRSSFMHLSPQVYPNIYMLTTQVATYNPNLHALFLSLSLYTYSAPNVTNRTNNRVHALAQQAIQVLMIIYSQEPFQAAGTQPMCTCTCKVV